jgi:hypothetical protein
VISKNKKDMISKKSAFIKRFLKNKKNTFQDVISKKQKTTFFMIGTHYLQLPTN